MRPTLPALPCDLQCAADLLLVQFDAVLMERVLVNLMANHQVHIGWPAIEIEARIGNGWLHLAVRDEGPGVPADRSHEIFRMFARGQREGGMPGMGLGEALCRIIVRSRTAASMGTRLSMGLRRTLAAQLEAHIAQNWPGAAPSLC